jgi:hypothetical protein
MIQLPGVSVLTPYMKLHHLLQKCSFFLIKLAAVLASGAARMKLHLFRQDLQDYQNFFGLVWLYPVHPVDPVR